MNHRVDPAAAPIGGPRSRADKNRTSVEAAPGDGTEEFLNSCSGFVEGAGIYVVARDGVIGESLRGRPSTTRAPPARFVSIVT